MLGLFLQSIQLLLHLMQLQQGELSLLPRFRQLRVPAREAGLQLLGLFLQSIQLHLQLHLKKGRGTPGLQQVVLLEGLAQALAIGHIGPIPQEIGPQFEIEVGVDQGRGPLSQRAAYGCRQGIRLGQGNRLEELFCTSGELGVGAELQPSPKHQARPRLEGEQGAVALDHRVEAEGAAGQQLIGGGVEHDARRGEILQGALPLAPPRRDQSLLQRFGYGEG